MVGEQVSFGPYLFDNQEKWRELGVGSIYAY
jgi:hypothetical protein